MLGLVGTANVQLQPLEADLKELGADMNKVEEALEKFAKLKPGKNKVEALEELEKLEPDFGILKYRLSALAKHALALEKSLEGFS